MLARYKSLGERALVYHGDALDIMTNYVRDGEVQPKPRIRLDGEIRSIAADDADTLSTGVRPAARAWVDGVARRRAR